MLCDSERRREGREEGVEGGGRYMHVGEGGGREEEGEEEGRITCT